MLSITIGALVVPDYPAGGTGLYLTEDGVGRPSFAAVYNAAPDSNYQNGRTLLSVRLDQSEQTFTVYAKSTTTAGLAALKATLEAALYAFPLTVLVTEDGVTTTLSGWPSRPKWNDVDSGMTRAHLARATCVIPVNP